MFYFLYMINEFKIYEEKDGSKHLRNECFLFPIEFYINMGKEDMVVTYNYTIDLEIC